MEAARDEAVAPRPAPRRRRSARPDHARGRHVAVQAGVGHRHERLDARPAGRLRRDHGRRARARLHRHLLGRRLGHDRALRARAQHHPLRLRHRGHRRVRLRHGRDAQDRRRPRAGRGTQKVGYPQARGEDHGGRHAHRRHGDHRRLWPGVRFVDRSLSQPHRQRHRLPGERGGARGAVHAASRDWCAGGGHGRRARRWVPGGEGREDPVHRGHALGHREPSLGPSAHVHIRPGHERRGAGHRHRAVLECDSHDVPGVLWEEEGHVLRLRDRVRDGVRGGRDVRRSRPNGGARGAGQVCRAGALRLQQEGGDGVHAGDRVLHGQGRERRRRVGPHGLPRHEARSV